MQPSSALLLMLKHRQSIGPVDEPVVPVRRHPSERFRPIAACPPRQGYRPRHRNSRTSSQDPRPIRQSGWKGQDAPFPATGQHRLRSAMSPGKPGNRPAVPTMPGSAGLKRLGIENPRRRKPERPACLSWRVIGIGHPDRSRVRVGIGRGKACGVGNVKTAVGHLQRTGNIGHHGNLPATRHEPWQSPRPKYRWQRNRTRRRPGANARGTTL